MSAEEREAQRKRRIDALRTALQEYAAVEFLQRVVRGALCRITRKKLRLKQSGDKHLSPLKSPHLTSPRLSSPLTSSHLSPLLTYPHNTVSPCHPQLSSVASPLMPPAMSKR